MITQFEISSYDLTKCVSKKMIKLIYCLNVSETHFMLKLREVAICDPYGPLWPGLFGVN